MSDQEPKSVPITIPRLLEVLEKGSVTIEHGLLRWSSNYTFLISLTHDKTGVMAVYKPQRGERPLWDFPDGTLCYREMAAFLTSQELEWNIVPPTVLRDGPHGFGSIQFYIDHDPEVNYFTLNEGMKSQLIRISTFDYIVNNADRKGGHLLLDRQGHIWGIDHGITFHTAPKLRTVIWDFAEVPLPDAITANLETLCQRFEDTGSSYRQAIQKLLSVKEIAAFRNRLRRLLECKRLPAPGSGPNYPWPPV
jgi:uncharacterized repeat protein (TIGR03843 family)